MATVRAHEAMSDKFNGHLSLQVRTSRATRGAALSAVAVCHDRGSWNSRLVQRTTTGPKWIKMAYYTERYLPPTPSDSSYIH